MNINNLQDLGLLNPNLLDRQSTQSTEKLGQRTGVLVNNDERSSGSLGQYTLRISLSNSLVIGQERFPVPSAEIDSAESDALFDFNSVARNVLGFVTDRIREQSGNGQDKGLMQRMLEQAREGISTGFKDARDILNNSGVLSEDLASGINKSEQLIDEGLSALERGALQGQSSNLVASAANVSQIQAGSLEVYTRDGDRVSISFQDTLQAGYEIGSGREAYAVGMNNQFSLSVEGELDADELKAIGDFLGRVDELAGQFFGGNLDAAFERASSLQIDDSELASFALNLNQVQTVHVQEVYMGGESNRTQDALGALASYLAQVEELHIAGAELFEPSEQQRLSDLMVQLNTGLDGDLLQRVQENFNQFNQRMLEIMDALRAENNNTSDRDNLA